MKAAALRGALSDRATHGRVHVVGPLVEGDAPKTKVALTALRAVTEAKRVLLVLDREDAVTLRSLRNEQSVHVLVSDQLNTYDVLVNDEVVFTEKAYEEFLARATTTKKGSSK
jgi:large subunit ribosomal protein L4